MDGHVNLPDLGLGAYPLQEIGFLVHPSPVIVRLDLGFHQDDRFRSDKVLVVAVAGGGRRSTAGPAVAAAGIFHTGLVAIFYQTIRIPHSVEQIFEDPKDPHIVPPLDHLLEDHVRDVLVLGTGPDLGQDGGGRTGGITRNNDTGELAATVSTFQGLQQFGEALLQHGRHGGESGKESRIEEVSLARKVKNKNSARFSSNSSTSVLSCWCSSVLR